jgi:hypothetical protein
VLAMVTTMAVLAVPVLGTAQRRQVDILIELERTGCFGFCPQYSVTIDGNGLAVYEGREYVRVKGRQQTKVPPATVRQLIAEFERLGFFALGDDPCLGGYDGPKTRTTIRIGNRRHRVATSEGGPHALAAHQSKIDRIAGTKKWVHIDATTVREMYRKGWRARDAQARAWLGYAAATGDVELVSALVESGIDVNRVWPGADVQMILEGATEPVLIQARGPAVIRALVAGADVNARARTGQTPLMSAAASGTVLDVEELIRLGARLDDSWSSGQTVLSDAIFAVESARAKVAALFRAGLRLTPDERAVAVAHADRRVQEWGRPGADDGPRLPDMKRVLDLVRNAPLRSP